MCLPVELDDWVNNSNCGDATIAKVVHAAGKDANISVETQVMALQQIFDRRDPFYCTGHVAYLMGVVNGWRYNHIF